MTSSTSLVRIGVWSLTLITTAVGTIALNELAARDGFGLIDLLSLVLFGLLTAWVSFFFWMSTVGFLRLTLGREFASKPVSDIRRTRDTPVDLPTTAVLVPVYNEDPATVFAGIQAMIESVAAEGLCETFDFFVLSDTTDAEVWVEEVLHWNQLLDRIGDSPKVYYRRRPKNVARKAGNIADFCKRWGTHYPYMIVLDADSLMPGHVLAEMVRRMENEPDVGLLQTPPLPLGGDSLLSRGQQFVAKLCGAALQEGLRCFIGDDGNYWGHNAIIRTQAFTGHCGLSNLPGERPFGGSIMSHDFVEAALMRRAGIKVRFAPDLAESYEQGPRTLLDYATRDQRWCQGNLQHLRIACGKGIPMMSRWHMIGGIMSYLASPLWLLFIIVGLLSVTVSGGAASVIADGRGNAISSATLALAIFGTVMAMLVMPRLYGLGLILLGDREESTFYGGAGRLVASTLLEFVVSVLLAPILLAFHTEFVQACLRGRRVEWDAQNRGDTGTTWGEAYQAHFRHTMLGLGLGLVAWWAAPAAFVWLLPVVVGLVLSMPLSVLVSSPGIGQFVGRLGLLLVPEESRRPAVLRRFDELSSENDQPHARDGSACEHLLRDPAANRTFLELLEDVSETRGFDVPPSPKLMSRALASMDSLSNDEKLEVLGNPLALRTLHREKWIPADLDSAMNRQQSSHPPSAISS
ncbi:Glucans biosynthesis glucosyltransferase H [Planctomycetes bacterium Pan216]|uniref:Glucans biosynthesis glucosyltransferase H n=1 Tax=Kolteria novifilia TaxID=2527975 RepID=A0A518AX30_9BACT|nr:Glucans biosynthesis glucosyltransferase H [Planctomycetes bacterium Pan216]